MNLKQPLKGRRLFDMDSFTRSRMDKFYRFSMEIEPVGLCAV